MGTELYIERMWWLTRATASDDWDVCLDGVWYRRYDDVLDSSDRGYVMNQIKEKNLEIQGIPFWNSCDTINDSGFKKMVRTAENEVYLIEFEK